MDKSKKTNEKIVTSIYLEKKVCTDLDKLAAKDGMSRTQLIRKFIDKGLSVESYEENIGFLTGIIRQEVKAEMSKQANRICAMQYKVGAIASANYFLAVKIIADVLSPSIQEDFKDINTRARQQGMQYMNQKVADVAEFLSDEEAVMAAVEKIKNEFLD